MLSCVTGENNPKNNSEPRIDSDSRIYALNVYLSTYAVSVAQASLSMAGTVLPMRADEPTSADAGSSDCKRQGYAQAADGSH